MNKFTVKFDLDKLSAYVEETGHEIVMLKKDIKGDGGDVTRLFTKVEAVITSHNQIEEIKARVELECKDYLSKSFDMSKLGDKDGN